MKLCIEGRDVRSTRGLNDLFSGVYLHNYPILAKLFLNENNLFRTLDDEVATGIQRAFGHPRQHGL